jgi:ethanolamine utilization protein EutA
MAAAITKAHQDSREPLIVIVEQDFAKALGQTIKQMVHGNPVICIDKIKAANGNYVDIGNSIAGVVPVVIKTLVF